MTIFRDWLLSVTAAAMLVALAGAMMPKGTVRKIGTLTGGLILILAIFKPLVGLDYGILSRSLSQARGDLEGNGFHLETGNFDLMKSIIEAKSAAYIEDKAIQMEIVCRAEVVCAADERTEYPYPASVTVTGVLTEAQCGKLTRMIETELAIPAQAQIYQQEGGETP